ncbi:MAG TPA: phosphatase domain-containing protein, partial [Acidothermaceae bacterium]
LERGRGWRRFLAITAPSVPVTIEAGGQTTVIESAYGGYIDAVLETDLTPGWTQVRLTCAGGAPAEVPVRVVAADERLGVITDIDDTIIVTTLPRPLVAFWNTFVKREFARRPVPGIAEMLKAAVSGHPQALVVYVSTGAWNVAPAIDAFLVRHGLPRGPMLLTDWGPAPDRWFRSGTEHKRAQLNRLMHDLPQLQWLLVGDDGQHDPQLYTELASNYPGRIRAVAIRELTAAEQLLSHGTPEPIDEQSEPPKRSKAPVEVRGADGHALLAALRDRHVIRGQLREPSPNFGRPGIAGNPTQPNTLKT